MYNIYIHEKHLLDSEKDSNAKRKILKFESKRKKKMNELSKRYNNRMKNFILNLCENPIILGQNEGNDNLTKSQEILNNQNEEKNDFVFGNYISDKKKIELINQEKNILKEYEEKNKQYQKKREKICSRNKKDIILLQPRMRFGPREEIENIVESINKNGSFNINQKYTKILNDHLKKIKENNIRYIKGNDKLNYQYGEKNREKKREKE